MATSRYVTALLLGLVWGITCGTVGFVCGYFGNSWFAEDPGTAGPLIGIFLTGPAAMLVGAFYGATFAFTSFKLKTHIAAGVLLVAVVGAVSLILTFPTYQPQVQIVEGSLGSCAPSVLGVTARTDYWRKESARVSHEGLAAIRGNWESTVTRMIEERPGTVVNIHVERVAWLESKSWW